METNNTKEEQRRPEKTRTHISQSDVPICVLDEALKIPRAIIDNYGGHPTTPLNVASALNLLPDSRRFRDLCGSAIAYGLTRGGYNAKEISVESLAKKIHTPLEEGEDLIAKREAALKPRVLGEFIRKYDDSPLPRSDIALNVLSEMHVPRERAKPVYNMILSTAKAIGIIKEIKGKQYIDLSGVPITGKLVKEFEEEITPEAEEELRARIPEEKPAKKELGQGIFVAHGKNRKPLEQLKRILDEFKVPYKVAVDEPNLGRPIGTKVQEIMESCNCAILLFTADDEFFDKDGNSIWRPSENVVYELGASGYLYGSRIVILKEEGVEFPTNFSDLGYISFKKDQLDTKSIDVLKELIGFGIIKIST